VTNLRHSLIHDILCSDMVAMATNAPEGVDEAVPEPSSPLKDLTSAAQKDATDGLTPQPSNSKSLLYC
jgi:hypothetical protein